MLIFFYQIIVTVSWQLGRVFIKANSLVIWHSTELQEQIESSLLLMDHSFFPFISSAGALELDSNVTATKKLTFYY